MSSAIRSCAIASHAHRALARGWVQGLGLRMRTARYLAGIDGETGIDLRVARQRLQRTLDELAAARRADLAGAPHSGCTKPR
jgi:hypothetical protein